MQGQIWTRVTLGLMILVGQGSVFGAIDFLTLVDRNFDTLGRFTSDPNDATVADISLLSNMPSLGDTSGARIDLSEDGRLFAILDNRTVIHEIDPQTGSHLGSYDVGVPLEGVAALGGGELYVNWEHNGILKIDFDHGSHQQVASYSTPIDIDGMDFDGDGNLVGSDLNQSGILYRIPLDGSPVQSLGIFPTTLPGDLSYSDAEERFYFYSQASQDLWELPWSNGSPAGTLSFTKTLAGGRAMGIAAVPEPSTALLLGVASVFVMRRRAIP